jgi:phenylacetic acid degradation operon negative regulatory protein
MGIKERRTKILLTLFLLSDVDLTAVQIGETAQAAFDLSFNQKTKGTLSALLKEGLIEKNTTEQTETAESVYKLTNAGFTRLSLEFPFLRFLKEKWDGKWRILSYEIPEKKRELRDKLRREVSGWGLGPWHRSFWLTPHPIIDSLRSLVSQKEEEQYIQAFESEHVFGDRAVLIEKVWGIAQLDKRYRELFKKWHDTLAKEGSKTDKFKRVISDYISILREDPGLPVELVGEKWIGYESFNIYKEIRSILLS